MAEVHEREGPLPELADAVVARAPVVQHRRIESRLVELVLDEQPQALGQGVVDLSQALQVALEGLARVHLPREVAAVPDPDRVRAGSQLHAQLEAFEVVLDRLAPDRGVGVAQAAELVGPRLVRPGPGRCWSSSSRCRARAPARRTAARPALSGLSQGMCSEMPGVERMSLRTTSQSSIFSKTLRGSPAPGEAREPSAPGADAPGRHRDAEGLGSLRSAPRCRCRGARAGARDDRSRPRAPSRCLRLSAATCSASNSNPMAPPTVSRIAKRGRSESTKPTSSYEHLAFAPGVNAARSRTPRGLILC